jgi:hypothetical protein
MTSRKKGPSEIQEERNRRRGDSSKAKFEKIPLHESFLNQTNALEKGLLTSSQYNGYDIPVMMAHRLCIEFGSTPAFMVLAPKLVELKIQELAFFTLLDLVRELKYARHEKEPVRTSILVIKDKSSLEGLGENFVCTEMSLNLNNRHECISLANMLVDGFTGGLVVTADGNILGDYFFKTEEMDTDLLLPKRYWKAVKASRESNGLLFLFAGLGRVCVFSNGQQILTHRGSNWHVHTCNLPLLIENLSKIHSLSPSLIRQVLKFAFLLSDLGKGALITVGDHKNVLKISDSAASSQVHVLSMLLGDTKDDAIIGLMSQDGATIISSDAKIVSGMTFLRPPPNAGGEKEVGKGSKHNTAVNVSAATRALCLAVSVDGGITIYSEGRKAWISG